MQGDWQKGGLARVSGSVGPRILLREFPRRVQTRPVVQRDVYDMHGGSRSPGKTKAGAVWNLEAQWTERLLDGCAERMCGRDGMPQGAFWSLMLRHAREAKGVSGSLCDQVTDNGIYAR